MRSFVLPLPEAGSGVSGLPLERSRENRLKVSNQNGAPSEIARIVRTHPPIAIAMPLAPWGTAAPRQPIGMPIFTTLSTLSAALVSFWSAVGVGVLAAGFAEAFA